MNEIHHQAPSYASFAPPSRRGNNNLAGSHVLGLLSHKSGLFVSSLHYAKKLHCKVSHATVPMYAKVMGGGLSTRNISILMAKEIYDHEHACKAGTDYTNTHVEK